MCSALLLSRLDFMPEDLLFCITQGILSDSPRQEQEIHSREEPKSHKSQNRYLLGSLTIGIISIKKAASS